MRPWPRLRSSSQAMIAALPSGELSPEKSPELTSTSSAECAMNASPSPDPPSPSCGATTWRIGRSYAVANSWSRSSWAGTAMIAPVPYSIST